MANDDPLPSSFSPTVLRVIGEFAAAMRADGGIDNAAADRLEKLLGQGPVPKPDEINTVLFEPPKDGAV